MLFHCYLATCTLLELIFFSFLAIYIFSVASLLVELSMNWIINETNRCLALRKTLKIFLYYWKFACIFYGNISRYIFETEYIYFKRFSMIFLFKDITISNFFLSIQSILKNKLFEFLNLNIQKRKEKKRNNTHVCINCCLNCTFQMLINRVINICFSMHLVP